MSRREFLEKLALANVGVAAFGVGGAGAHTEAANHGGYPDAITHFALHGLNGFIRWLGGASGYIGEVGFPSNLGKTRHRFFPDQERWRVLGEWWYRRADAAGLWVTAHEASERYYALKKGGYYLSIYLASGDERHKVVNRRGYQSSLIEAHGGPGRGVNFTGGQKFDEERMSNAKPGIYGKDYWYPTVSRNPRDPKTHKNSFEYLAGRDVKLIRLGFRWERMQPRLHAPLSATELKRYRAALAHAKEAGLKVVVDLHNFGGYCTSTGRKALNTSALPISAFVDVWLRLSQAFANNQAVVAYDLMNEPYNHGGISRGSYASPVKAWEAATQQVVKAIRKKRDTKKIMVPTYTRVREVLYTHDKPWIAGGGNIAYTAHQYFSHYDPHTGSGGGHYNSSYRSENHYYSQRGY